MVLPNWLLRMPGCFLSSIPYFLDLWVLHPLLTRPREQVNDQCEHKQEKEDDFRGPVLGPVSATGIDSTESETACVYRKTQAIDSGSSIS